MFWKSFILILMSSAALAKPQWAKEVISQSGGNCEQRNLVFSALRFSKIPLKKTFDGKEVFLRLLFYINSDGSYTVRLNEQLILGCAESAPGTEEVCRFVQISDGWLSGSGSFEQDLMLDRGVLSKEGSEPYRGFRLVLSAFDLYPELVDRELTGTVVMVNFDSAGRNADKICSGK